MNDAGAARAAAIARFLKPLFFLLRAPKPRDLVILQEIVVILVELKRRGFAFLLRSSRGFFVVRLVAVVLQHRASTAFSTPSHHGAVVVVVVAQASLGDVRRFCQGRDLGLVFLGVIHGRIFGFHLGRVIFVDRHGTTPVIARRRKAGIRISFRTRRHTILDPIHAHRLHERSRSIKRHVQRLRWSDR